MTYEHICKDKDCAYEWEDEYSIKDDPPTTCPKCKKETAQRLVSGGSGRGVVELYGEDLVNKVREDAKKFKKEVYSSEKTYANVIGESNYQKLQSSMDKNRR